MWRLTERDRRMEPLKLYGDSSGSGEPSSQSSALPAGFFMSTSAAWTILRSLYDACARTAMLATVSLFLFGASGMLASQTLRFALRLTTTSDNFSSLTPTRTAPTWSGGGERSSSSTRKSNNQPSEE